VIYVDTSVVLAQLLAENRRPPASLWESALSSGRAPCHQPAGSQEETYQEETWVRTPDALHLASARFLQERRLEARLATYDAQMAAAAQALAIPLEPLP
jgi:hypothetical protein